MKIKEYLVKEQGFSICTDDPLGIEKGRDWIAFRQTKIETDTLCLHNKKPPHISVSCYSLKLGILGERVFSSYQVEVVQENDLGWIKFEYYGMDEDYLIENFDKIERSLIRTWEASWSE